MIVPFLDLAALHAELKDGIMQKLSVVIDENHLILGPELEAFEREFASFCNVDHAVGVSDGLEALQMLLESHKIGMGDEVIVPSNTFIATWLAVSACGAVPIPVEPCLDTFNITASVVERAITTKTKAIIAVHLYGLPADMDALEALAKRKGLLLFEDAAQAHGAITASGRSVGSFGDGAAFSFYPGKNLGALGDGGAVTTNCASTADYIRRKRNYGSEQKYVHAEIGRNSRLDELQAAILRLKLPLLKEQNKRRASIAALYSENIDTSLIQLPQVPAGFQSVFHLYVIRSRERDRLRDFLSSQGIGTGIHYPTPPHLQKCYSDFQHLDLPIAQAMAEQVLSLPISPVMTDEQVFYVIEALNSFK